MRLSPRNYEYVHQIICAADDALGFIEGVDEEAFYASSLLQNAVMMCLVRIGENGNRLIKALPELNEGKAFDAALKAYSIRNRAAHNYFSVDFSIIWSTLNKDLPVFIGEIKAAFPPPELRTLEGGILLAVTDRSVAISDDLILARALADKLGIEHAMDTGKALEWLEANPDAEVHFQGPTADQPAVARIVAQARTTALYDQAQACIAELGREEPFRFAKGAPLWSLEIADSGAERVFGSTPDEAVRETMFQNLGATSQAMRLAALETRRASATTSQSQPKPDQPQPRKPTSSGSSFTP